MDRWQIKTTNTQTGDTLCTTEMPYLPGLDYRYESCIFLADGDSDVLARYDTQEDAEAGHDSIVAARLGTKLIAQEGYGT